MPDRPTTPDTSPAPLFGTHNLADGTAHDISGLNDPKVQVDGYMEVTPRAARGLSLTPRYELEIAIAQSAGFQRDYRLARNIDGHTCRYSLRIYHHTGAPS